MALVNCGECNREISDKARACPHCGVRRKSNRTAVLKGVVAAVIVIGILAQCADEGSSKPEAQESTQSTEKATGPDKEPSASTGTATIGRSTLQILGDLPVLERSASVPLRDGSPRESIRLNPHLHLETIGEKADLRSYTMMFGIASDDKAGAIETAVLVASVLANTFPDWMEKGRQGGSADWFNRATKQLGSNIKRNKDDPEPVILDRDGLRIRYSAVPVMKLFFVTVEPVGAL
ncbi:hypothetical protein [Cupriavidus sp. H18C2]|uniref:hypothetical protein n=1 Tax=Cupriavidus sp. H18C2 TaxID=3241602 RepID=UPI003BF8C0E0